MGMGNIGKISKAAISNMIAASTPASTPKDSQEAVDSSSGMLQKSGTAGDSGLAASGIDLGAQPTLTSGIQNTAADSNMFGNMTNGLGENRFGANFGNGLAASGNQQNGYQILGAPRII